MERNGMMERLTSFLARTRGPVSGGDEVVAQARELLEQAYVHLPDDALTEVAPLGRLEALQRALPSERSQLHRELLAVFARLGDRHTHCALPEPFASHVAFLPFLVGEFLEGEFPRVTVLDSAVEALERGDILVSWNGAALAEVLGRHRAWQHGAHPEARHAKAVQTLTFRPLSMLPPPDEEAVVLECVSARGMHKEVRLVWQVADAAWLARHFASSLSGASEVRLENEGALLARRVDTSRGTFGYIRVDSFAGRPEVVLEQFTRALTDMPHQGVILDLRRCEDGIVRSGERLLQLFTSRRIQPQPFQFRLTPLTTSLVRSVPALAEWRGAVERAAAQGRTFSEALPLTPVAEANGLGRKYTGAVVLLTSALTYSTAEMFAAGFQDHGIGRVVGTAARTGGGGASPWPQSTLFKLSGSDAFRPLPEGPRFRVAVRRCQRVHARAGLPLEREGVVPDVLHAPTRADLLHGERDLLEVAGEVLTGMR
ncbi:S41 family peptidase [Myxococcus sp. K15C18031901]|uniref:S41 family peptidase n=1 Tax=Myxococcus dinghuensis TaxID=2906761 RepID=UPI0020A7CED5|nr:S41 family peptidase [Myxococcus dinghuensis]MCP3101662.1 S41 family peptidase [Myxococcus dinghuensis]